MIDWVFFVILSAIAGAQLGIFKGMSPIHEKCTLKLSLERHGLGILFWRFINGENGVGRLLIWLLLKSIKMFENMPFKSKENALFDKKRELQKELVRYFADKDRDPSCAPVLGLSIFPPH